MHLPSEIVSPATAALGFAASGAALLHSVRRLQREEAPERVPLLSVLSAFVFAAQMVNFPVGPSSGHLVGGVLLAALLGPEAAVLGMAAVLTVQCLVFADGGLLALGLNVFNMGVVPALTYALLSHLAGGRWRVGTAMLAAFLSVVLAASLVPIEASPARTGLPVATFLAWMVGLHALIGLGEALITGAVLGVLLELRPGAFAPRPRGSGRGLLLGLLGAALFVAAVFSRFASSLPDGLERALAESPSPPPESAPPPTALLPDYSLPGLPEGLSTGAAGFLGTLLVLGLAFATIRLASRRHRAG